MGNNVVVFDKPHGGTPLRLSQPVGTGGEGAVYVVPRPNDGKGIAVKVFSEKKLKESRNFLSEKLAVMVKKGRKNGGTLIRHPGVAWPQMLIYGDDGKFVGYAMRHAKGVTISRLAHAQLYKTHFPNLDRVKVAKMLVKLLKSADDLHRQHIRIGDVNLNNVLCDGDYNPCWIDAGSYQIGVGDENDGPRYPDESAEKFHAKTKIWRCPVGRPEMTPPEHLGKDYSQIDRTYAGDLFSLAILAFQCMMLGKHPYEYIKCGSPVENLMKGHFPYGNSGIPAGRTGDAPQGPWRPMWNHYPDAIKQLCTRALAKEGRRPSARPHLKEWIIALQAYSQTLNQSEKHRREMIPQAAKPQNLTRSQFWGRMRA